MAQSVTAAQYIVLAWNDLGMHCLNPTYDTAVILPPYNTVWAQVVAKGNPPRIVTTGLVVQYILLNNTSSADKTSSVTSADYGQFWDNAFALFGVNLAPNTGLNLVNPRLHNGLSGLMIARGNHFEVDGIPATPVNDSGIWNPYQVIKIIVRSQATGEILATTRAIVPTSDEINCGKAGCHDSLPGPFADILAKHDAAEGTTLASSEPVLCADCHGSPVLNKVTPGSSGMFLSQAIHGFHSRITSQPACYDCHPGPVTRCNRSLAHNGNRINGNCTTCHGRLAHVAASITNGRIPWSQEPACSTSTCHTGITGTSTRATLYRNARGHGGLSCPACHQSPHAILPTNVSTDSFQARQYQGVGVTIGSCAACHSSSKGPESGGESGEFAEEHGGANPQVRTACHMCHTAVSTNTALWPHAFNWIAR